MRGKAKGNGGGDWVVLHGDAATLDVRMTIETHDGAIVSMRVRDALQSKGKAS